MTKAPRMSPEDLSAFKARQQSRGNGSLNQTGSKRFRALGRLPKGQMNKTEEAYAARLEAEKAAGRIIDWKFHAIKVRLADNAYYEADFLVLHSDMSLAIHEVKGGFTTDKAQLKIKLVAELLPWFRMLKATKLPAKLGGGWKIEEF